MREIPCSICGELIPEDEILTFDDALICRDCYDTHTTVCDCCHRLIWTENDYGTGGLSLCESCHDEEYTTCDRCGRLIHNDDACYFSGEDIPYCQSCYDELDKDAIHSYNYKPAPIFYGDDNLYMGVELEVDKGGEYDENAEDLLRIANFQLEHMYCKHDGSINEGFEMVSHPMTLDYHKNEMPWRKVFQEAIAMSYRSHQTSTCGLHVHVNRSAFGNTYEERDDVISRIIYFVEAHWNELLRFSRRTEASINRWAARYGIEQTAKKTYGKAKGCYTRYVCVNLNNCDTIEFRIFRGTLRYETFIAALELVHEICEQAIRMKDEEFESMCWADFVRSIPDNKPELINYLKSKQLYINEPVASEEEI